MSTQQRSLFDLTPDPWEEDHEPEKLVATVVFPEGPPQELDYLVPDSLQDKVEAGRRVRAPLGKGNRTLAGYCVRLEKRRTGPRRLKYLYAVLDPRPLLSPSMIRLTRWIADYYLCDWAQVLQAVVPAGVRVQAGTRQVPFLSLAEGVAQRLPDLKLPPKQVAILKALAESPKPLTAPDLARAAGCTQAPITTLRKKGLIQAQVERVANDRQAMVAEPRQKNLVLNPAQQAALEAIVDTIHAGCHRTLLIHGVTGSGKTEVYIQAIQRVIEQGRQAIVLVPEISLTPQTVQRFRSRFDHVAVLHSHLTDAERHMQWQRIADDGVQVVVGARSAIFAPVPRLGLIVIDEEHENSFKQETSPRYHARDVARTLAAAENVPLVLGSATPSLESWHRAQTGEYQLIEMPHRVLNRPLPRRGDHRPAR